MVCVGWVHCCAALQDPCQGHCTRQVCVSPIWKKHRSSLYTCAYCIVLQELVGILSNHLLWLSYPSAGSMWYARHSSLTIDDPALTWLVIKGTRCPRVLLSTSRNIGLVELCFTPSIPKTHFFLFHAPAILPLPYWSRKKQQQRHNLNKYSEPMYTYLVILYFTIIWINYNTPFFCDGNGFHQWQQTPFFHPSAGLYVFSFVQLLWHRHLLFFWPFWSKFLS